MKNARLYVQSFKKTLPASHVSRSNEGTLTKFAATSNPLFTPNYHRDRRSVKIQIVGKDAITTNGNGNKEKKTDKDSEGEDERNDSGNSGNIEVKVKVEKKLNGEG